MGPLHLQWQQRACLKQPFHKHLHGPRLAAVYDCYRKPLAHKQTKKSLASSSSTRSNQVERTCVWHRFCENCPTANTPLFLLKQGISNGGPCHCGPSHSCNQCIKQTLLSSRSWWEPASIHHTLVSTRIGMHTKHEMHAHTYTQSVLY